MIARTNMEEGGKCAFGFRWGTISAWGHSDQVLEWYVSFIVRVGEKKSVYQFFSDQDEPSRRAVGFFFAVGFAPRFTIINNWWPVND